LAIVACTYCRTRFCRRSPADIASGKIETLRPFQGVPGPHNVYDVVPGLGNNVYFTDFRQRHIGGSTPNRRRKAVRSPTRIPRRAAAEMRRTGVFGEYRADRIGMSTPRPSNSRSGRSREWSRLMTSHDKNGEAWTGSMLSDQVTRLNPTTARRSTISCRAAPISGACSSTIPPTRHVLVATTTALDRQGRAAGIGLSALIRSSCSGDGSPLLSRSRGGLGGAPPQNTLFERRDLPHRPRFARRPPPQAGGDRKPLPPKTEFHEAINLMLSVQSAEKYFASRRANHLYKLARPVPQGAARDRQNAGRMR